MPSEVHAEETYNEVLSKTDHSMRVVMKDAIRDYQDEKKKFFKWYRETEPNEEGVWLLPEIIIKMVSDETDKADEEF